MSDQSAPTPTPPQAPQTTSPTPPDAPALLNAGAAPPAPPPPAAGAPEAYAAFKVPDGFSLDEKVLTEASATFKELGLTQDAAQKLVDMHIRQAQEAAEQPYKAYTEMREGWRKSVLADPIVGNGADLKPEVKQTIARMYDVVGDTKLVTEFKEAMDMTGVGDHPAFVKLLYSLAQRATEGRPVAGTGPTPASQAAPGAAVRPNPAQAIYPNLPSTG
jgi:hypothetical protein